MEEKVQTIFDSFKGRLLGTQHMRFLVCTTLALFPKETVDFVIHHCWFLSSFDESWAFTFTGADIKNDHLIFLSDDLLLQDSKQIQYTIAHEIGHVILRHRNSVLIKQTQNEIARQEEEADEFARKYIV